MKNEDAKGSIYKELWKECFQIIIIKYEYSEYKMGGMMHDMDRLQDWMKTVPDAPALESS